MLLASTRNSIPAALISLQPRQVMLEMQKMMKKEKKNYASETLENGSNAKTLEPIQEKEKKKNKSRELSRLKALVLQSVASYLDVNGFSKTLSALRSEASLAVRLL